MSRYPALWPDPATHLRTTRPDHPVLYLTPTRLQATARRFLDGFPGLVTYAIKANDTETVVQNLVASGIGAFDVASPDEMAKVRKVSPDAAMHYNNPVRSKTEIEAALSYGIRSWSIDDLGELEKLAAVVPAKGSEISVRLKLPVVGGYYDFGSKFGAEPDECVALLKRVVELGFTPSMTFHPGTQCENASAWTSYVAATADVARRAGVTLSRLNVGGGFPAHRNGDAPDLEEIFSRIRHAVDEAYGPMAPALLCEPGRALVAEAFTLCARVKSRRASGTIYLNDGIYGGMAEAALIGSVDRVAVFSPEGQRREGPCFDAVVFGPTCDSLDRIKGTVSLPETLEEDDYILFEGMGAYCNCTATRFNGYGAFDFITVERPE